MAEQTLLQMTDCRKEAALPACGVQLTLTDRTAQTSVFLHPSGEHIVIRYAEGGYEAMLPYGSFAWERAVRRAMTGSVFL